MEQAATACRLAFVLLGVHCSGASVMVGPGLGGMKSYQLPSSHAPDDGKVHLPVTAGCLHAAPHMPTGNHQG